MIRPRAGAGSAAHSFWASFAAASAATISSVDDAGIVVTTSD